jgi:putative ABC transport system permease protein
MSPFVVVAVAVFALAYGAVAVFVLRHRSLGRLALRQAGRRRFQSLLVVVGLTVATTAITAALVAADSVDDTARNLGFQSWGPVDLTVTAGGDFFDGSLAERIASSPAVGSVTDGLSPGIDIAASASDVDTRRGVSEITVVGFDTASQQQFGPYVMTSGRRTLGADLGPDEILLSRVLARKLGASPGDVIHVRVTAPDAPSEPIDLRVAGITRPEGPGGYTLGAVAFAPLPTVQRIVGTDLVNIVKISVPGSAGSALTAGHRAAPVVRRAVSALDADVPLQVREAKSVEIKNGEAFSVFFRGLLIGMSALVAAVGATLVVNLMVMLAEERRPRLGVLRAIGLKRSRLIGLAVAEGALYSLVAGALGAVAGAAVGRLVADRFAAVLAAYGGPDFDWTSTFTLKVSTVIAAFAVGTALTLAVVYLAARRTSRLNIVAAIRDVPSPPRAKHHGPLPRRSRLVLGAVVGVAAVTQPYALRLVGGIVLVIVLSSLLRSRLSPQLHATVTGAAIAVWSVLVLGASDPDDNGDAFILVMVLSMLTSVFGLTIVTSANLRLVEKGLGILGGGSSRMQAALRPPLAHLSRRPMRTGLTTGLFAVIVGMLVVFAVFYDISKPDYDRLANGYDVRVTSTGSAAAELPRAVRADVKHRLTLKTRGYVGRLSTEDEGSSVERGFIPLVETPQRAADDPPVRLQQRADRFASDRAVWDAVARDPSLIVTDLGLPGQHVTLEGADGPVTFTVVASPPLGLLSGVFANEEALAAFAASPPGTTTLLDLVDANQGPTVVRTINRDLFEQGTEAETVRALLDHAYFANRTGLSVIDVLVRMGLGVGVAGFGIVALRTVTERRRVIGIQRALGFTRRAVMSGLIVESVVTATIGAVVGIAAGLAMGYQFYLQDESRTGFGVDVSSVAGVLALIYVAVLLVTAGPAWQASRLAPADAIRHSE